MKKPLSFSFLHRFMSAMSSGLRSAALGLIPCWLVNFKTEAMPGKLGLGLRGKGFGDRLIGAFQALTKSHPVPDVQNVPVD